MSRGALAAAPRSPARRAWPAIGALALVGLLWPPCADAGGDGPGAAEFSRVVEAWSARRAAAVVGEVPKDGRLRIDLLGTGDGRVTGTPTAEQAEAVLADYFADLDSASLTDASGDARGYSRTYDYTYRPNGSTARTTRLTFTLTARRSGGYGLSAVVERAKKT